MDTIERNRLICCPVCGNSWLPLPPTPEDPHPKGHPTGADSTCWRYRPQGISAAETAEVARQAGLAIADLGDSARPLFLGALSAGVLPGQNTIVNDPVGLPLTLQSLPADLVNSTARSEANWADQARRYYSSKSEQETNGAPK